MIERTTGGIWQAVVLLAGMSAIFFASAAKADSFVTLAATTTPVLAASSTDVRLDPEAFRSVVKIKTYVLDADHELALAGSGSGVIISPEGLVLTNNHVISIEDDFDGRYREASYVVCLPQAVAAEPECDYTARLVRWNKDLDTALLKITAVPKLSQPAVFSYLSLNVADTAQINDTVFALGYPSIGGDTVTVTRGVVSGKSDKYGKRWIKTDAVISFGNSGGAALDSSGRLIGLPTQAHSDLAGSIGYILNLASVNGWLEQYRNAPVRGSRLDDRLGELARKQKILLASNKFINFKPPYNITKPAEWDFIHEDEDSLTITRKSDDEGGAVYLSHIHYPYEAKPADLDAYFRIHLLESNPLSNVVIERSKPAAFGNKRGKVYTVSEDGQTADIVFIPIGNYFLKIIYDYGKEEKDRAAVDGILKSLAIGHSPAVKELKQYRHADPKFRLSAPGDWVLYANNSKAAPLSIRHKKLKEAAVGITVIRTDSQTRNLSAEEFLKLEKADIEAINKSSSFLDLSAKLVEAKTRVKLSRELTDLLKLKLTLTRVSTKKIVVYNTAYYKKVGDKYLKFNFEYYGQDKNAAARAEAEFVKLLSGLSLK